MNVKKISIAAASVAAVAALASVGPRSNAADSRPRRPPPRPRPQGTADSGWAPGKEPARRHRCHRSQLADTGDG
jgi:hypothetical protein